MRRLLPFLLPALLLAQEPDPLASMNATFRTWYKAEKARRLAHPGPVLVVEGDKLALLREGRPREEAAFVPPDFHRLKAMAHVPLALELKLAPELLLSSAEREELKAYLAQLKAAAEGAEGDSARIAEASEAFLDKVLATSRVDGGALQAYVRRMAPLTLRNAQAAVAAELAGLQAQVGAWRAQMDPAEWKQLHVVVMGSHMAREREASMQFFLRLLKQKREGDRVLFLENQWDEAKALDLLATHLTDRAASQAFYGDPWRLHRDLLSDGAKTYLDRHPPK